LLHIIRLYDDAFMVFIFFEELDVIHEHFGFSPVHCVDERVLEGSFVGEI
jgi:hypothetical protein